MQETTKTQEETIKDAISIMEQVCSKFVGNLNEHQIVQNALLTIKNELIKKE